MTDDELRRLLRQSGDAAPDFSEILERQKRRYRPRPLAIGLLVLLIAVAPAGWLWTNINMEPGASFNPRREAITQNRLPDTGAEKSLPAAAALVPTPVAAGLLKPPPTAKAAACKPVAVMSTHTRPPYPAISQRLGESGTVTLQITVARDGHVSRAMVTHSSGSVILDQAAASFVRQHYLWQPLACASARTDLNVEWKLGREPGGAR